MKMNRWLSLSFPLFSLFILHVDANGFPCSLRSSTAYARNKLGRGNSALWLKGGEPENLGEYGGLSKDAIEFLRAQKIAPT